MPRLAGRRALVFVAIAIAAIAFPLGVIASHQFGDVPDSNTYHNDIDAIADAGVTTGCGGGNYCPSAFVTRGEMAAFMNRLGALAPGRTPVVNATKLDGLNSTDFVRYDAVDQGRFVCAVPSFRPQSSTTPWASDGVGIWASSATDASFECTILIPDGATISAVRWTIDDSSAEVVDCFLNLSNTAGAFGMASALSSGTPGWTTLTDTTISLPETNNAAYVYRAGCILRATGLGTMLHKIVVEYDYFGLPTP
jgi:hypothetical protein